jgi:sugar lactone lactonase YvrE
LKLSAQGLNHYVAVLRPLAKGDNPIVAELLRQNERVNGLRVRGENINDVIWFGREPRLFRESGMSFEGRYGFLAYRPDEIRLALIEGNRLATDGVLIESEGPAVYLRTTKDRTIVRAQGTGKVHVRVGQKEWSATLSGETIEHFWQE